MAKIFIYRDPLDRNQFILYDRWERKVLGGEKTKPVWALVAAIHTDTLSDLMGSEWVKSLNSSTFPVEATIEIKLEE